MNPISTQDNMLKIRYYKAMFCKMAFPSHEISVQDPSLNKCVSLLIFGVYKHEVLLLVGIVYFNTFNRFIFLV